jgi:hypothetical protein
MGLFAIRRDSPLPTLTLFAALFVPRSFAAQENCFDTAT